MRVCFLQPSHSVRVLSSEALLITRMSRASSPVKQSSSTADTLAMPIPEIFVSSGEGWIDVPRLCACNLAAGRDEPDRHFQVAIASAASLIDRFQSCP